MKHIAIFKFLHCPTYREDILLEHLTELIVTLMHTCKSAHIHTNFDKLITFHYHIYTEQIVIQSTSPTKGRWDSDANNSLCIIIVVYQEHFKLEIHRVQSLPIQHFH